MTADGTTKTYRKMHLGGTERIFFDAGELPLALTVAGQTVGIAICADSSRPTHPQTYAERGASIYATGVFLNSDWYATDVPRLRDYAAQYRMLVVMANHASSTGTYTSVGKSMVWRPDGTVLVEAAGAESVLLIATNRNATWHGEVVRIEHAPVPTHRQGQLGT